MTLTLEDPSSSRWLLLTSVTCWVAITNRRSFSFFLRLHSSHQLEKSLRYFFNSLKAELRDNMKIYAYVIDHNYAYNLQSKVRRGMRLISKRLEHSS